MDRHQALKPEVFGICGTLRAGDDMLDSVTGARISIAVELPDMPCYIRDELSQFETALINIAVNARDSMGWEMTLTLRIVGGQPMPKYRGNSGSD
ncbi:hybrid sensor histidine kinase/response regulator, partial [Methylobacterium sp. J-076]|nr:hybrid sensor histidine kinase/response regulator [Methylobacterium sp. J-076]